MHEQPSKLLTVWTEKLTLLGRRAHTERKVTNAMEVKLTDEQLTEAVTNAITSSILGERLKEQITRSVNEAMQGGFNRKSVVEAVVATVVRDAVLAAVNDRRDEIKALVADRLTGDMIETMISKISGRRVEGSLTDFDQRSRAGGTLIV